tara:strand:- start:553 stop:1881 length:1329 start_codon:yes stop_codon:yes gene_type:complete
MSVRSSGDNVRVRPGTPPSMVTSDPKRDGKRMAGDRMQTTGTGDTGGQVARPDEKQGFFGSSDPTIRRGPERDVRDGRGSGSAGKKRATGGGPRINTNQGYGRSCPDPSMLILMADGSQKKAGDLVVGDLVKTYHEKDLEKAAKLARSKSLVLSSGEVENSTELREQLENSFAKATLGEYKIEFVDIVSDVEKIKLTFDSSEIICSLTHKFFVKDSWKEAKEMIIGDEVSDKKLISTELVENGDVVHITVEEAHTYICEGLLSHNKRYVANDPRRGGGAGPVPPRPTPERDDERGTPDRSTQPVRPPTGGRGRGRRRPTPGGGRTFPPFFFGPRGPFGGRGRPTPPRPPFGGRPTPDRGRPTPPRPTPPRPPFGGRPTPPRPTPDRGRPTPPRPTPPRPTPPRPDFTRPPNSPFGGLPPENTPPRPTPPRSTPPRPGGPPPR